jgi:hypothetical protein
MRLDGPATRHRLDELILSFDKQTAYIQAGTELFYLVSIDLLSGQTKQFQPLQLNDPSTRMRYLWFPNESIIWGMATQGEFIPRFYVNTLCELRFSLLAYVCGVIR